MELRGEDSGVVRVAFHEFGMTAALDDATGDHDVDDVGAGD